MLNLNINILLQAWNGWLTLPGVAFDLHRQSSDKLKGLVLRCEAALKAYPSHSANETVAFPPSADPSTGALNWSDTYRQGWMADGKKQAHAGKGRPLNK